MSDNYVIPPHTGIGHVHLKVSDLEREPREQILLILQETMSPEDAEQLMNKLPALSKQKKESARHAIVFGLFVFLAGLGLKLIMPGTIYVTFTDILAWCCMIGGVAYMLDGWYRVNRYN